MSTKNKKMEIDKGLINRIRRGNFPFANISPYKESSFRYLNTEFERCKTLFKELKLLKGCPPKSFNF